jgi:hypothetical protein
MLKKLLLTLFVVLIHTVVLSATKTYIGPNSGDWNTADNWSPTGTPTSTDAVIIPSGKIVAISSNSFAQSISISGALSVNSGIRLTVGSVDSNGNFIVNSGGRFSMGSGNDLATLIVYGNYINNGSTDFWKSDVVILGDLLSPTTSTLQKQGNVVVGGNIIGDFNITGSEVGVIYAVNPNATVTITPTSLNQNVTPGTPVPITSDNSALLALVNSVIYGSDCAFTISETINKSACTGGSAIFTAATSGSSPAYQWEVNMGSGWSDLLNDTVNYSGVATGSLTVSNITVGMNNYKFRARITVLGCSERGNYGFLTVNLSPAITTQPVNQLDCEGRDVNFKVVGTGSGLSYSWHYKKPGDLSFTPISSATSNVSNFNTNIITIRNVGSTQFPNGTQYQVVVSNGICSVTSNIAMLTVNEITDITSPALTPSQTKTEVRLCSGANYSYTVVTSYPSNVVSYQWKINIGGAWNNVVDGLSTHYVGAKTATLSIINGTPSESGRYQVYITFRSSGSDCNTISDTRSRSLIFLPLPLTPETVLTQPSCSNSTGTIAVTVQSPSDVYSFDNGVSYQDSNVKSALAGGTYKVIVKNSGGCLSSVTSCVITAVPVVSTWNGSEWAPSAPTQIDKIIFSGDYLSPGDISGCSCQVNSGAVVIRSGHSLVLTNEVTVSGGSLTFENNSSLIQTNTGTTINTGNIIYKRSSTPIINDDYTYWSSPTSGSQTLLNFSPNTQRDKFFIFDNDWTNVSASNTFLSGIGYAIRSPEGISATVASSMPFQFTGTPNNGTISVPVTSQKDAFGEEEGIRLVGNPYPSAIDADAFIDANITTGTGSKTITGTLYFWTHNHTLNGNDYLATDYATYTKFGGTGTGSALSGTGNNNTPTKYIASGQGFFVLVDASGSVTFNNAMRVTANNANFYKMANTKAAVSESHRIWINLTNSSNNFSQALLGYSSIATNGYDPGYDGVSFDGGQHSIYSLIGEEVLTIQAKGLPFYDADTIPIGYVVSVAGNTVIGIDHVDGMFVKEQKVYLEDLVLGVIHDIKGSAYSFNSEAGTFNNRFVLRYGSDAAKNLTKDDFEIVRERVVVSTKNRQIKINSEVELLDKVQVWDLQGKLIYQKSDINMNEFIISNLVSNNQAILIKVGLRSGQAVIQKIVY